MLIMHRVRRALVAVVLALGVIAATAAAAAAVEGSQECAEGGRLSSASISSSCPSGGGTSGGDSTEQKDQAGENEESSGSGGGSGSDQNSGGAGYKKFGSDEEHPEAPDSWARAAGEGSQGLADYAEREWLSKHGLMPKWGFSEGFFTLYSAMEAIGWVLAIVAIFLASRRMASGDLEGRTVFARAFLRFLLLTPIFMAVPLAVAWINNLGWSLAGGFLKIAGQELASQLEWVVSFFAVGTIAALAIPGGSAVIVGIGMFLMAALGALILELIAAHFLVYALTIVLPVLIGASVNPEWRGGVRKATGALLAAMLAPAAMTLVWAISFSVITPQMSGHGDPLARLAILFAGICLGIAAPAAAGMILGYIMPAFNLGGAGREQAMLSRAQRSAFDSAKRHGSGPQGRPDGESSSSTDEAEGQSGTGSERGRAAANVTDADAKAGAVRGEGASAAAGESGGAGGAAAAGPAAGVVAAAAIWNGIRKKSQAAAAEVTRRVTGAEKNAEAQGNAGTGSEEPDDTNTDSATGAADADLAPYEPASGGDADTTGGTAAAGGPAADGDRVPPADDGTAGRSDMTDPAPSAAENQASSRTDVGDAGQSTERATVAADGATSTGAAQGRQGSGSGAGGSTASESRHPGIAAGAAAGAAAAHGQDGRSGRGPDFVGPDHVARPAASSASLDDGDPLNPPPYVERPREPYDDGSAAAEPRREPAVVDEGDEPLAYQNAQGYQDQPYADESAPVYEPDEYQPAPYENPQYEAPTDPLSAEQPPADVPPSQEADSWGSRQDSTGAPGSSSERGGA